MSKSKQKGTGVRWRPVPDYPGYKVCDAGYIRGPSGLTLQAQEKNNGYLQVNLYHAEAGRRKMRSVAVHVLVLSVFTGERPAGLQARHLNGDQKDNRISNLKWGTAAENAADRARHGNQVQGQGVWKSVLSENGVRAIRLLRESGMTQVAIADALRVDKATVNHVLVGRTWKQVV